MCPTDSIVLNKLFCRGEGENLFVFAMGHPEVYAYLPIEACGYDGKKKM